LYRVAQEALNNCLKHANASQVNLRLRRDRSAVTLSIVDDGPRQSSAPVATGTSGLRLGLLGMRERLLPWQGVVQFSSDRQNGTELIARVPLEGSGG
jgi:signal transduction histidine kinase